MSDEIKDQIESALSGRSEEELRKLAVEIEEGKVFTSNHLGPEQRDLIGMVFMPLSLGGEALRGSLHTAAMVYEYYDKALPRSINGLPMFVSMLIVSAKDMPALELYIKEYREMKAKFFAAPIPPQV